MGEANAFPEQFHQSGIDRRVQTSRNLLLAKNGPEESERRLRSRCRYEKYLVRARREQREPVAD